MVVCSSVKPKLFRCFTKLHQILLPIRKDCFLFFHLFATCSIQVPNGIPLATPFFNEGITKDGNLKGFGCHQWGRREEGVGGRERHCGDQICFNHLMATNFGRGFFKVYEFKNVIHDSFFSTYVLIWVLCLCAPLQPMCETLGELR